MHQPLLGIARRSLLLTFVSFSLFTASAQSSKEKFEKRMIADFCTEFDKIKDKVSTENMNKEMGMLILPLMSKYKTEMNKEWKLDLDKLEDIEKMGFRIGQLAAIDCPSFRGFIMNNMNELKDRQTSTVAEVVPAQEGIKEEVRSVSGKLLKVEGEPFSYLQVQTPAGKMEKIYWMEFFPGADKLEDNGKGLLNQSITISYREIEVYHAPSKEYRTIKVASRLTQ